MSDLQRHNRVVREPRRDECKPLPDWESPYRMPVEVIQQQMQQFGMHCRFNNDGVSVDAIREVMTKRPPLMSMSYTELARHIGIPRATMMVYLRQWHRSRHEFVEMMRAKYADPTHADYIRGMGWKPATIYRRLELRGLLCTKENINEVVFNWKPLTPGVNSTFSIYSHAQKRKVPYPTLYRWLTDAGMPPSAEACDRVIRERMPAWKERKAKAERNTTGPADSTRSCRGRKSRRDGTP